MNIKTRLKDEELFCVGSHVDTKISALNKKGIYTVEDFLNCDISSLCSNPKKYRITYDILSCKYLKTPLVRSVSLDKIVVNDQSFFRKTAAILTEELGFYGFDKIRGISLEILKNVTIKEISIIDYLRKISKVKDYSYKALVDFYIEYYDANLKDKNETERIKKMRDEVVYLTKQRDNLNLRINELMANIERLEKGHDLNGK